MEKNCTYKYFKTLISLEEKCSYALNNCEYEYINFYKLHFCILSNYYILSLPLFFILLFIIFYLLSDTSNKFLSDSLTKIVDKFKMSQSLAAMTLLAFGNGASDVISSLVASSDSKGIEIAIGSLIGSGLFLTSLVYGMLIVNGENLSVNPKSFVQDVLTYIFSLIVLFYISLNGVINIYESIFFVSIYFFNVLVSFIRDWKNKNDNNINIKENIENLDETKETSGNVSIISSESLRRKYEIEYEMKRIKENDEIAGQIIEELKDDLRREKENDIINQFAKYKNTTVSELLSENIEELKLKLKSYYWKQKEM
jgi:sodium/potassium/calcium exchanger 6